MAKIDEIERQLKELRQETGDCVGMIVGRYVGDDLVEFWNGQDTEFICEEAVPYPKIFVSIRAAIQRAIQLGEDWEVSFWTQPDYYPEASIIHKYVLMTGIRYCGSVRR